MSVMRAVQKVELQEARAAGKQCMWLPPIYSSMQNRTQGLWMFEGKLLISVQTAKSVYNSQLLRCVKISATSCDFEDDETNVKVTLPNDCVQKFLRSARSMTFASCQGRSMQGVGIHTHSAKFSKRHLFVALSRGRSSQKQWIMD